MKLKTLYVCQQCSFQNPKWTGKCPECQAWNSLIEEVVDLDKGKIGKSNANNPSAGLRALAPRQAPQSLQTEPSKKSRLMTQIGEWDQVLGGGMVHGALVLLSGEPGIGKSTLTLQVVNKMAEQGLKTLYITGEESVEQVSARAKRLGITSSNLQLLYESSLEAILETIEKHKPEFLVLDSIQVIASEQMPGLAGSISQVKAVTEAVMMTIKTLNIPTLLIGHVNKEGQIAGPKVLEHLVDTVLLLEGTRDQEFRLLRALKNRYGNVSEVGLFAMSGEGMEEMKNPGERVLKNRPTGAFGTCLTMSMEGNRPILMEVQALVSATPFGYPKRASSGFDRNRLELLIAVLQKHTSLNLADQDIYINVVGGLRLNDPSADLAVCMAIASSSFKKNIPEDWVVFGEVGLTGEIRSNSKDQAKLSQIKKMGLRLHQITRLQNGFNL